MAEDKRVRGFVGSAIGDFRQVGKEEHVDYGEDALGNFTSF